MASLEKQIRTMYAEMVDYAGQFGDPIDHGSYNPYDVISDATLSTFERTGVSIAILHYLATSIDNATYEWALSRESARLRPVLANGLLEHEPLVRAAADAFFQSEAAFLAALRPVYRELVLPEAEVDDG